MRRKKNFCFVGIEEIFDRVKCNKSMEILEEKIVD